MKKLAFLLIFLLAIQVVAADNLVSFNVYEAIVEDDGSMTTTTTPVNDLTAYGYVCNDADCSASRGSIGTVSSVDNQITVSYPTRLQSRHGYGHFFTSEGYIAWEQRATFSGNGQNGPYDIYVGKMSTCRAPIDSFAVINDAHPNEPVQFEVNTSLDSTVWSAIAADGPIGFTPEELAEHYSVDTQVTLQIWGPDGSLLHEDDMMLSIPFSGAERAMFSWLPERVGRYSATVTTSVPDEKCLSELPAQATKAFSVIGDTTNTCYALANNLNVQPLHQRAGEPVTIGVETIANYYDDVGELHALPSRLTLIVEKNGNMQTEVFDLPAGSIDMYETNMIPFTFQEEGLHLVSADVRPLACPVATNLFDTVEIEYVVEAGMQRDNSAPVLNAQDVFLHEDDGSVTLYDLDDYTWDAEGDALTFSITDQTNMASSVCSLNAQNVLACDVLGVGQNVLEVIVTDEHGAQGMDLVVITVERTYACSDGMDNDGDGNIDMNDAGCMNEFDDNESDDPAVPECSDGMDNDNDGFVDMQDPGCSSPQDTNEADGTTACQDGVDNDNDGSIDLDDPGCNNNSDDDEGNFFDLFLSNPHVVNPPAESDEDVRIAFSAHHVPGAFLPVHSNIFVDGTFYKATSIIFDESVVERNVNVGMLSAGTHTVRIVVDADNQFSEANEDNNELSFTFTVNEPSNATFGFANVPPGTAHVGVTYDFDLDVTTNQQVIFAKEMGPSGLSINSNTGRILWTPQESDLGSHVVIVSASKDSEMATLTWTITVRDTNGDGSVDAITYEDVAITSTRFAEGDIVRRGEPLYLQVGFDNQGSIDLEESRVVVSIPELGLKRSQGPFDLNEHDDEARSVVLDIPSWAPPGEYLVRISVGNTQQRAVTHRYVTVE